MHSDLRVRLPLVDLTGLPEAEREAAASRLATDEARRPFDLGAAPLFRARVLKLAEDDHRLYLTLHHLVFDGVSLCRVMLPELAAIYGALADGRGPTAAVLAEPALQYGDYAIWREGHAAGEAVRRQMDRLAPGAGRRAALAAAALRPRAAAVPDLPRLDGDLRACRGSGP